MVPPVVRASVGGPGVRARLLGHVIVRMGVGLFDGGGVAERTKRIKRSLGDPIRTLRPNIWTLVKMCAGVQRGLRTKRNPDSGDLILTSGPLVHQTSASV